MQRRNMEGFTESASLSLKDAGMDAREDAREFPCRICGRRARERKRRRDGSWYLYDRCRRCRRETAGSKTVPVRIREGRLLYLLELLHEHLLKLKEGDWEAAPKKAVVQRLKALIAVVKG